MTDYLQRLAMRGARTVSDGGEAPQVLRAAVPIAEIIEEVPVEPARESTVSAALGEPTAPPHDETGRAIESAPQSMAGPQAETMLPQAPDAAVSKPPSAMPPAPPPASVPPPLAAKPKASPPDLMRPPAQPTAPRRERDRLPASALPVPTPSVRSVSDVPVVAEQSDASPAALAAPPLKPAPVLRPVPAPRPATPTAQPAAITVGSITIDLMPPAAAPRPPVERTRGFARYERLRRGLKS